MTATSEASITANAPSFHKLLDASSPEAEKAPAESKTWRGAAASSKSTHATDDAEESSPADSHSDEVDPSPHPSDAEPERKTARAAASSNTSRAPELAVVVQAMRFTVLVVVACWFAGVHVPPPMYFAFAAALAPLLQYLRDTRHLPGSGKERHV